MGSRGSSSSRGDAHSPVRAAHLSGRYERSLVELAVVEYRVEQLAAQCGVSVDTVRFYQSKGLLPPPRRAGRVALYVPEHMERINHIRALQRQGLTLAGLKR